MSFPHEPNIQKLGKGDGKKTRLIEDPKRDYGQVDNNNPSYGAKPLVPGKPNSKDRKWKEFN